jgi:hypothetical protein
LLSIVGRKESGREHPSSVCYRGKADRGRGII